MPDCLKCGKICGGKSIQIKGIGYLCGQKCFDMWDLEKYKLSLDPKNWNRADRRKLKFRNQTKTLLTLQI